VDSAAVTIVRAVQTCEALPSLWDAWDDRGRYWCLRYRHGRGSARQYASGPDWQPGEEPAEVLSFEHGDRLDGFITLEEFAQRAGLALALAEYKPWNSYLADETAAALLEAD